MNSDQTTQLLAIGAFAFAALNFVWSRMINSPKETEKRINQHDIDIAKILVVQQSTAITLDRLVKIVDRYFEDRMERNGHVER